MFGSINDLISYLEKEQNARCHESLAHIEQEYENLIQPYLKNFYTRRGASLGSDVGSFLATHLASIRLDFKRLLMLDYFEQVLAQYNILCAEINETLITLEREYSYDKNSITLIKRIKCISETRFPEILIFYHGVEISRLKKDLSVNDVVVYMSAILDSLESHEKRVEFISSIINDDRIQSKLDGPSLQTKIVAPPNNQYYKTHNNGRSPVNFIAEVYKDFLTGEFTRADLRRADQQAEMALRNWERKNGRAPLNLPTKKELNDKRLAEPDDAVGKHEKLDRQRLRAARRHSEKRRLTPD